MINFECAKIYCNEDISLIENYNKAIADSTQTWQCHHRRENISSRKELIIKNEYYSRPASELIFLTKSQHKALHNTLLFKGKTPWLGKHHTDEAKLKISLANKGKNLSEEHKQKIAESLKGNKNTLGKHHTEETKRKMSEAKKGHPVSEETKRKISAANKNMSEETRIKMSIAKRNMSEETKRKMSESHKGRTPTWLVGKCRSEETKRKISESLKGNHLSEESKLKMSESMKGHYWFNNGIKNVFVKECPEGFVRGRLKKVKQS